MLSKLADEFIKNGHDVTFVSPRNNSFPYYPTKAKIISVPSRFENVRVLRVIFGLWAVFNNILKMDSACVVANHNLTSYLVFFLPNRFDKYYYVQAYEVKIVSGFKSKLAAYLSYFLPLKKIVNSERILPGYFKNVVGVVPAGIDLDLFGRGELKSKRERPSTVNIGFIGREEVHKGSYEIIQAICGLIDDFDMHLNVAVYMPSIPGKLKLKTSFFDIKNDHELAFFYRQNDIFVATGLVEDGAFHYPCAESMAAGCIVISNYSPLLDRKDSNNLFLRVSEVNPSKIAKSIKAAVLMDDSSVEVEMKKNARTVERYSWDLVASRFLKLISDQNSKA